MAPVFGQVVELAGTRAPGMGGAFVAVANDSSATWWNPAGLAAGPFLDMAITRSGLSREEALPAGRSRLWSFTLGTPPFGVSYYRFRLTGIREESPTGPGSPDRQERRTGLGVRSHSVGQFGATILHTIFSGVHIGTTVKYLRVTPRGVGVPDGDAPAVPIERLLDAGDALEGGDAESAADLDAGVLAVVGAFRVGGVVRNIRAPEFGALRLPRQVRAGAAFDADLAGLPPFIVALDADLRTYDAGTGDRRVVALGAEHWLRERRIGIRGGVRVNTAGARDEAVTAGASVAPRAGLYVDGYVVRGSGSGETGWGVAARVSF